jgi:hypothetical protein
LDLSLRPAGLAADTVTASRMTLRAAGASTTGPTAVQRKRRQLTGINNEIGEYGAVLTCCSGNRPGCRASHQLNPTPDER